MRPFLSFPSLLLQKVPLPGDPSLSSKASALAFLVAVPGEGRTGKIWHERVNVLLAGVSIFACSAAVVHRRDSKEAMVTKVQTEAISSGICVS